MNRNSYKINRRRHRCSMGWTTTGPKWRSAAGASGRPLQASETAPTGHRATRANEWHCRSGGSGKDCRQTKFWNLEILKPMQPSSLPASTCITVRPAPGRTMQETTWQFTTTTPKGLEPAIAIDHRWRSEFFFFSETYNVTVANIRSQKKEARRGTWRYGIYGHN